MNTMTSLTLPIQNLPRRGYTATLLKNNCIIYIGGKSNESESSHVEMNMVSENVQLLSLLKSEWAFSCFNKNETIIIYGGGTGANYFIQSEPVLATLDTTVDPMRWIIPNDSSTSNTPPSLRYHSATLYNNYMLIAFGRMSTKLFKLNDRIYIYDVVNSNWITTMDRILDTTVNASLNNHQNYWLIMACILTGVFIFIIILPFLIYKLYKFKRDLFSKNMAV
ncbi:galactose oxidase [Gigaspora margarita]|uniref:Galactose oxidase n=1 Tax=Gigaspora margarita TaxID=4874 RepID=A0A8H4AY57_GIGMA|nr:galactose oxidase [Gigaspora margarita]